MESTLNNSKGEQSANAYATRLSGGTLRALRPAKAIRESDGSIVIVECRRYNSRLSQEALGAVAYRIRNLGAAGGITVSPMPLQAGAAKVAKAEQIEHVELRPESTREQWIAKIDQITHIGITETAAFTVTESLEVRVLDKNENVVDRRSA